MINVRSPVRFNVRSNVRSNVRPNEEEMKRALYCLTQKLHRSFREFPDHCFLKAIVYRIVFLSKLESFTGADMQRRFRRTCPVCGRPDLKNISTHLLQVHGLSSEERKPYLKQAQVSSWQPRVERSPHMTQDIAILTCRATSGPISV